MLSLPDYVYMCRQLLYKHAVPNLICLLNALFFFCLFPKPYCWCRQLLNTHAVPLSLTLSACLMLSFPSAFSQTSLLVQAAVKYTCCPAVPNLICLFDALFFLLPFSQTLLLVQETVKYTCCPAVPNFICLFDALFFFCLFPNLIVGAGSY